MRLINLTRQEFKEKVSLATRLAYKTNPWNEGERNPNWGKKTKEKTIKLMRELKLGEKNPGWKGDNVGYGALHAYINFRHTKPIVCQRCGKKKVNLDLANISGKYTREVKDYAYLCRTCHMTMDGRLEKLIERRKMQCSVLNAIRKTLV